MEKHLELALFSILLILVLIFSACGDTGGTKNPTAAPNATKNSTTTTPVPSEKLGSTNNHAQSTEGVPQTTAAPLDGRPNAAAEILFQDNFDNMTIDELENQYDVSQPQYISFSDGKMQILKDWSAFKPYDVDYEAKNYRQYEFSVDYYSDLGAGVVHNSFFVGSRVPKEMNAAYAGGFWVAFQGATQVHVYPGGDNFPDTGSWAERFFTIDIPESFLNQAHKITVVDTIDEIYYYMSVEGNDLYLIVKAVIDDTDLLCYGNDGELIWQGECGLNEAIDFSLFSHFTNSYLDNLMVKALQ